MAKATMQVNDSKHTEDKLLEQRRSCPKTFLAPVFCSWLISTFTSSAMCAVALDLQLTTSYSDGGTNRYDAEGSTGSKSRLGADNEHSHDQQKTGQCCEHKTALTWSLESSPSPKHSWEPSCIRRTVRQWTSASPCHKLNKDHGGVFVGIAA